MRVLRRRGDPVSPAAWDPFIDLTPSWLRRNYFDALEDCGRVVVASLLNAKHFDYYPLSMSEIQMSMRSAWQPLLAPVDEWECEQQLEDCRAELESLKSRLERHYS